MAKNQIFIVITFFCFANCKSLKSINKVNDTPYPSIKTFDIDKFNQFKDEIGVANYTYDDGSHIEASKTGDQYSVIRTTTGSPYSAQYAYHLNLTLKTAGQLFYRIWYGSSYLYDEQGKLIKQTDEDQRYKFSLDDLVNKLLNKYKIDLMKPKEGMVVRRYLNNSLLPEYEIRYPSISDPNKIRRLVIDGNNGHIILDTTIGPPRDS